MMISSSLASLQAPAARNGDDAYDLVRMQFPFFRVLHQHQQKPLAFMENAGGSQCPAVVIDAMAEYMRSSYAQPGARYPISTLAENVIKSAHDFVRVFVNAGDGGDVAFGPSTSRLLAMLGNCYGLVLQRGDEVIVHEANHEANVAPWVRMAERAGLSLKFWLVNHESFESSLDELGQLLSPHTRIVAVAHVSNLLGEVLDLERVVRFVKERVGRSKVRVVADGVAYAPHRALDVAKWGVDWYVFSTYKVYGPHMAVLFGTTEAFMDIKEAAPNFDFISSGDFSRKFELGGVCHEGCAGILALALYLNFLARLGRNQGTSEDSNLTGEVLDNQSQSKLQKQSVDAEVLELVLRTSPLIGRGVVEAAFAFAAQLEQPLQKALISYLNSNENVVIIGPKHSNVETRVPTISFIHKYKTSSDISQKICEAGYAIRNGHMYAYRLVARLSEKHKLLSNTIDDGVVRISMVHYNTPDEVIQLIACLDDIL